ncbi:division plane positioning ATPase MipZ [Reyranella sp.]|uniref:division plane positioning ATPase MipZ n=1 Tax=Reyranella sp. TaxID=1929291 RepID=UPI0025E27AE2|nr:division plane positioning ATPase MipZ [Reyranella sp.]
MSGSFQPAPNPSIAQTQAARTPGRGHVLVIGNEKGGSGKSTTALHIAVSLMSDGAKVATLDLDARQGTLSRYLENRAAYIKRKGVDLPMPIHTPVPISTLNERSAAEADERARLEAALEPAVSAADFVIVDTPGSDTHLSRLAHTWADSLLTPLNDSFIDLDLLARVDPDTLKVVRPSIYSEAVWKQRQIRAVQGGRPVDWIVMRNRLSALAARNKRDMSTVIEALSRRIGFRVAAGLSERVIYKELFLNGLTLLDLKRGGTGPSLTLSHVAARQEVRDLVAALNLPPLATESAPTDEPAPETTPEAPSPSAEAEAQPQSESPAEDAPEMEVATEGLRRTE